MTTTTREIELKLELDRDSGPRLREHPLLNGAPAKTIDQRALYYDTPTRALRAAGFSLRIRQSGGRHVQTIKYQAGEAAGLFDRPEWESDVAGFAIDFDAVAATPLARHLGRKLRAQLDIQVETRVRRTAWRLGGDGAEVELVLDESSIISGDAHWEGSEIELELREGDPARLFDIARTLADAAPLRLGVLSKADRGFALADGRLERVAKAEQVAVSPTMTTADGFAAIAYSCLRHFRLNEPLVLGRRDPAALHQARVAMRRLRSLFTLFGPVISDAEYPALRAELRWFTDQLGDARNLDVLLRRLNGDAKLDDAALRPLVAAHATAYARVAGALESARLRVLMLDLVRWIETGAWRGRGKARAPLPDFARKQLDKRWRKVRKTGKRLAELDPEPRHRLRIDVKKLRYAIEFLSALQTREASRQRQKAFIAALERIQEELGELNDIETARELLARLPLAEGEAAAITGALTRDDTSPKRRIAAAQEGHAALRAVGPFWR